MPFSVHVLLGSNAGKTVTISGLESTDTIAVLIQKIVDKEGLDPDMMILIFHGKELCDTNKQLRDVGIRARSSGLVAFSVNSGSNADKGRQEDDHEMDSEHFFNSIGASNDNEVNDNDTGFGMADNRNEMDSEHFFNSIGASNDNEVNNNDTGFGMADNRNEMDSELFFNSIGASNDSKVNNNDTGFGMADDANEMGSEQFFDTIGASNEHKSNNSNNTNESRPFYQLLGVSQNATTSEIKKAYKKLARQYHPDRHHGKSAQEIKVMSDKFTQLHNAYETLIDDTKRARYDKYGEFATLKNVDITKFNFDELFDMIFEEKDETRKCEAIHVYEKFGEPNCKIQVQYEAIVKVKVGFKKMMIQTEIVIKNKKEEFTVMLPKQGNEANGFETGDVFVHLRYVAESPKPSEPVMSIFKKKKAGHDEVFNFYISVAELFTGVKKTIRFDDRHVTIEKKGPINPGDTTQVQIDGVKVIFQFKLIISKPNVNYEKFVQGLQKAFKYQKPALKKSNSKEWEKVATYLKKTVQTQSGSNKRSGIANYIPFYN